ncbi:hypothetical protein POM88_001118 [Heracleum sosnowskyi]|uniref:RNase III domain-containing protein n=1 Tax=Heracleum sosnowskyi TaxID=360622 RepID=A0AAD8JCX6_9APIA|nr:hypothetical protein POM88_001118 [Heracleum sosnowskyi]
MHADYCNQNFIATTKIPTVKVLEAITTKKCQEKFDLDSLEALGAAVNSRQIVSSVQNLDPSLMGATFGWESENSLPKVVGDVIESLAGAILVDSGYRKDIVFRRPLLDPLVSPETLKLQLESANKALLKLK